MESADGKSSSMEVMAGVESGKKLHVVFIPYFITSHIAPLVDAARLFAANGVKATIISTPSNAAIFQRSVDQSIGSGHDISILTLKFPSVESGLPEGIENFSDITSTENLYKLYQGIQLLQKPMENLIISLKPHCIFSDMFCPWTVDLARELKIPRLLFYPNNFISHVIPHNVEKYAPHANVNSDFEEFLVPGLPDKILMTRSQLEDNLKTKTGFSKVMESVKQSELQSYAMVQNTVYELEPAYADYYRKVTSKKYYTIGPLFYFPIGETGNATLQKLSPDTDDKETTNASCLSWLDSQEPRKVLFICFGSFLKLPDSQLCEIAKALKASGQPFIWAIRSNENEPQEFSWLPDGFEEKMLKSEKGVIIRGWVPQLRILNHPAVGGFMTHCGWNSLMEAITAGVPLITWPLIAEQFYNEKLIGLMGFGVRVGSDVWHPNPIIENLVGSKQIKEAIESLMGDSEGSKQIRERAKEAAAMVKTAVSPGGSSYENLVALIEDIRSCVF